MSRVNYRGLFVLGLLAAAWEIASGSPGHLSGAIVPFGAVYRSALALAGSGDLWLNYRMSLVRVACGFGIGAGLGLALGTVLAMSHIANRLFGPLVNALRQVPMFGWIPLIGLWFGMGESSKLAIVAMATFYPVALNTYEGLRGAPHAYLEVATMFRLSRFQLLRRVLLPAALPAIMTGLKQGLGFAWMAVVGAELFMTAAPGVGAMLGAARAHLRMDIVLLGMAIIGLTGYLMNHAMSLVERRLLRWRPTFS